MILLCSCCAILVCHDPVVPRILLCQESCCEMFLSLSFGRYGEARLKRSSVLAHNWTGVGSRLLRSLETGRPFRVGVLGGSFAVPHESGTWSANVTRWLDAVLGAANGSSYRGLVEDVSCQDRQKPFQNCVAPADEEWKWRAPTFCAQPDTYNDVGDSHHDSDWPVERICENWILPKRKCQIFAGSGARAVIVNGAQGGTSTLNGAWSISRALQGRTRGRCREFHGARLI